MAAVHDVLRRLLAWAPGGTQDERDQVAALIDQDEGQAPAVKKES